MQASGESPHGQKARLCDIGDAVVETPFNIEAAHRCIEDKYHEIVDAQAFNSLGYKSIPARAHWWWLVWR